MRQQRAQAILLVTVLWLMASPARADFFEDLSFAVGKLGDAVEDTVTDVLQDDKAQNGPTNPTPPQAPAVPQVTWTSPSERDSHLPPLPSHRPTASANSTIRHMADDAPAPRAAPARRPVSVVAALPALPGSIEASAPLPRPAYAAPRAPSRSANSTGTAALQQLALNSIRPLAAPTPAAAPVVAPVAATTQAVRPLANSFQLRFDGQSAEVTDRATEGRLLPPNVAAPVLANAATRVKEGLNLRLTLTAYTTPQEGQSAEARRRSFARAMAVKDWLVRQGVRRTQIDMKVELAPGDNGPADRVDLVATPDL